MRKRKEGALIKYYNSLVSGKLSLPFFFPLETFVTLSYSTSLLNDVIFVADIIWCLWSEVRWLYLSHLGILPDI